MNDFLEFLAERKYFYYRYFRNASAWSSREAYERVQKDARYDEVINIINHLPLEEEKIVNKRFEELRDNG